MMMVAMVMAVMMLVMMMILTHSGLEHPFKTFINNNEIF